MVKRNTHKKGKKHRYNKSRKSRRFGCKRMSRRKYRSRGGGYSGRAFTPTYSINNNPLNPDMSALASPIPITRTNKCSDPLFIPN